jgi:hypothetical protein
VKNKNGGKKEGRKKGYNNKLYMSALLKYW